MFCLALGLLFGFAPILATLGLPGVALVQLLLIAAPAVVFARLIGGSGREALRLLGVRKAKPSAIIGGLLIGASFWYINLLVVIPLFEERIRRAHDIQHIEQLAEASPIVWTLITLAVLPALCEELLMRGVVARGLRPALGLVGAIVVSALLFGVFHLSFARLVPTALLGAALAYATLMTGSIVPSCVAHLINNAVVLLIGLGAAPRVIVSALENYVVPSAVLALTATISGFWLIWRARDSS